jgi:alpha-tubulin suppressor-like RCC1 family protein
MLASRPPVELAVGERPVQIAAGDGHSCALLDSGQLRCWGPNFSGQLGNGASSQGEPQPVAATAVRQRLTAVIAGSWATCGRTAENKVLCWGYSSFSQLGIAATNSVNLLEPAEAVVFGDDIRDFELARDTVSPNTCALAGDTVRCWGRGAGFPQAITGLSAPVAIEAGAAHACVLQAGGELRCWRGDNMGVDAPATVLTGVRSFATGHWHTCAVTTDARLMCWLGHQLSAPPGSALEGLTSTPQLIPELTEVVQVTAGDDFSCALSGDGRLWCFGRNDGGQLGLGVADPYPPPPPPPPERNKKTPPPPPPPPPAPPPNPPKPKWAG